MHSVVFNKCLNKEHKYYGLSYLGLIGASIIGLAIWVKFGMTAGIISTIIAYGFCAYYASLWHGGSLQRFIYWQIPINSLFGGKYLPESYRRCLV